LQHPFFFTAVQSASAWQAKRVGSSASSPAGLVAIVGTGVAAATAFAPASGGGAIRRVSTAASSGAPTVADVCALEPGEPVEAAAPVGASGRAQAARDSAKATLGHARDAFGQIDATTRKARDQQGWSMRAEASAILYDAGRA
jgi:hypothetical protein